MFRRPGQNVMANSAFSLTGVGKTMASPSRPRFKAPPHPALDYRPPRSLRLIKAVTVSFISIASIIIVYVVWWFALALSLNATADDWIAARTTEGWTIQTTRREIDGFPFLLRLSVDEPRLVRPDGLTWSADKMTLHSLPLPGQMVVVRSSGAQSIALPPAPPPPKSTSGYDLPYKPAPVTFTGNATLIELQVDGLYDTPEAIDIRLVEVALTSGDGDDIAVSEATITASYHPETATDHTTSSGALSVHANGIRLPSSMTLPLGSLVHSLDLDIKILGAIATASPISDGLKKWRDDGGTVDITSLELRYGPMWLRTSGTLALDGNLQPVGAATAKMRGFFDAIEQMRVNGQINAKQAVTAKVVLGAMARQAADGGPPVLNLPLSIQDRVLNVGPVPLLEIPPILWPDMPAPPVELSSDTEA